jgi:hypothetical protein
VSVISIRSIQHRDNETCAAARNRRPIASKTSPTAASSLDILKHAVCTLAASVM